MFTSGQALLVGVGVHQYIPQADVPITVADAEAVAEVLKDPNTCGYPPSRVKMIDNQVATKAGILAALDELALVGKDDTVFFFYCGHGALGQDGHYYLVSHDARIEGSRVVVGSGVREDELLEKIKAIPAKRMLLIFNACFSGNISPSLDIQEIALEARSLPEETSTALLAAGSGRIIITACRENQRSFIGTGSLTIFTQALVDGLRGKGVRNTNGFISAYDLYEHIFEQVQENAGELFHLEQEPEMTVVKGVGPFAVALYRGASILGEFEGDRPAPDLPGLRQVKPEKAQKVFIQQINTGGGAFIGGSVNTGGGSFVGRDQINSGEDVGGRRSQKDKEADDRR